MIVMIILGIAFKLMLSPPSNGISNMTTITAMSWKIKIPNVTLPCRECVKCFCCIIFITIAVLENDTKNPKNIALFKFNPIASPSNVINIVVRLTCKIPPAKA